MKPGIRKRKYQPVIAYCQKFINYANTANQGDYVIISNPVLYNNGSGVNNRGSIPPVPNYRLRVVV